MKNQLTSRVLECWQNGQRYKKLIVHDSMIKTWIGNSGEVEVEENIKEKF